MHDLPLLTFNCGLKFQDSVCNISHDLTMLCLNISDIAIITVKNDNYRCIIYNISKSEASKLFFRKCCAGKSWIYIYIYS